MDRQGKTFVDVGTNIGQTLLDFMHIRKRGEEYLGFEANPFCAQMVADIIAANRIPGAHILPVGLAGESMLMQLYSGAGDGSDKGASLIPGLRPTKELASQWVACFRFDDAFRAIQLPPAGLIKIDVEGAELEVLSGMSETMSVARPDIVCEVLHRDPSADREQYVSRLAKLHALLNERRYAINLIVRTKDDARVETIQQIEAFPDQVFNQRSHFECDYLFTPL